MDKNNTSNSTVCRKIRQALSSNPALRAIHRISSYHQQPKPVTIDSNSPQHHKVNKEGSGAIAITFDYSTPKTKVASPVVGYSERATKVATKADDAFKGVHSEALRGSMGAQHGHGEQQHLEQQGKKSIDINDTINEYIKRTKEKIRTVSNIGRGQNNPVLDHEAHGTNKNEDHKEQFSDFIHHAKKKFRTTTIVGKTSSLKRG